MLSMDKAREQTDLNNMRLMIEIEKVIEVGIREGKYLIILPKLMTEQVHVLEHLGYDVKNHVDTGKATISWS